jgi:hypothetical protein
MIATSKGVVAGKRMHNEAIAGGRVDLDRKRTIRPAVTGARRHYVAPCGLAAERASNRTRIKRHRPASWCGFASDGSAGWSSA